MAVRRPLWRLRLRHWLASDGAGDVARFTVQLSLCLALLIALYGTFFLFLGLGA